MLNVIVSIQQEINAIVLSDAKFSDSFDVSNGIKQDCLMALVLCALFCNVEVCLWWFEAVHYRCHFYVGSKRGFNVRTVLTIQGSFQVT